MCDSNLRLNNHLVISIINFLTDIKNQEHPYYKVLEKMIF